MLVHVDETPHIIMACCVLHNFCELHGILEFIVCDIKEWGDQSIDFDKGNCSQEKKQAKAMGELLKYPSICNLGWMSFYHLANMHFESKNVNIQIKNLHFIF
jgi:hypothetical protein